MSHLTVAHHRPPTSGHPLAAATARVDQLAELRALRRQADVEERRLTRELIALMQEHGAAVLASAGAVAHLERRITLTVDPELFLEAAGPRAFTALRVQVERARELLDGATLAAISETTTVPVLRLEARAPAAALGGRHEDDGVTADPAEP